MWRPPVPAGPTTPAAIDLYFHPAVWAHAVKPAGGTREAAAPELRRAYDDLGAAWRAAVAGRARFLAAPRAAHETDADRARRVAARFWPPLEEAARRAEAALAAAERQRATEADPRQIERAAELLSRRLRQFNQWVERTYPLAAAGSGGGR